MTRDVKNLSSVSPIKDERFEIKYSSVWRDSRRAVRDQGKKWNIGSDELDGDASVMNWYYLDCISESRGRVSQSALHQQRLSQLSLDVKSRNYESLLLATTHCV